MRIGYPCINRSVGCAAGRTFRLASYSEDRLMETVENNLGCIQTILEYNLDHGFFFFRISSDTVPFASHPVCEFDWARHFGPALRSLGRFVKKHRMRISMHPDQFVLLSSPRPDVVEKSIAELAYHARFLDAMDLPQWAKMLIHMGGAYGDKEAAVDRFVAVYQGLDAGIKKRLVIENDERLYTLADCLEVHRRCGVPVVFDAFHHHLKNQGESLSDALAAAAATWGGRHGPPIVHYSSQKPRKRPGAHAEAMDPEDFQRFVKDSRPHDFDLMLEIKDKEKSAQKALGVLAGDSRFSG